MDGMGMEGLAVSMPPSPISIRGAAGHVAGSHQFSEAAGAGGGLADGDGAFGPGSAADTDSSGGSSGTSSSSDHWAVTEGDAGAASHAFGGAGATDGAEAGIAEARDDGAPDGAFAAMAEARPSDMGMSSSAPTRLYMPSPAVSSWAHGARAAGVGCGATEGCAAVPAAGCAGCGDSEAAGHMGAPEACAFASMDAAASAATHSVGSAPQAYGSGASEHSWGGRADGAGDADGAAVPVRRRSASAGGEVGLAASPPDGVMQAGGDAGVGAAAAARGGLFSGITSASGSARRPGRSVDGAGAGAGAPAVPVRRRAASMPWMQPISEVSELDVGIDVGSSLAEEAGVAGAGSRAAGASVGAASAGAASASGVAVEPEVMALLWKAVGVYSKALSMKAQRDASVQPLPQSAIDRMSSLFVRSGDTSVGQKLLSRALAIFTELCGEGHPSVASTLKLSGCLYVRTRDYDNAMEAFSRAVRICEACFGAEHNVTADVVLNVALLHTYRGEYAAAVPCFQRALRTYIAVHGEEHEATSVVRAKLATAQRAHNQEQYTRLLEEGMSHQAAGRVDEALATFEACLGLVPNDATCAYMMAGCYSSSCSSSAGGAGPEGSSVRARGLAWLSRAVEWGFDDLDMVLEDPDLAVLRQDEGFWHLLASHGVDVRAAGACATAS